MQVTLKRVVVTGLGTVNPLGNDIPTYYQSLRAGKSGAGPITKFDTSQFKAKFACEVKNFDALQFVDKKESRKMDVFCHYALAATDECLRDSGLNLDTVDKNRVGVILASGMGGMLAFEEDVLNFAQTRPVPRFSPFFVPRVITDIAPGHISIKYGFRGINFTTVSACASSTNAIADAFNYLRLGKANIILTGGAEAAITQSGVGGFTAMKAMSERNDDPQAASRPFDRDRDGFVIGEGAGVLMLETLEHALARGAKIYAEVVGCGFAADAYHLTGTHPEGLGAQLAMRDALDDARLQPSDIDYLNVHATSTPMGDISEAKAVSEVFAGHLDRLTISATKSMTGHLLGAAGAVEAIASILAIEHSFIPPTINFGHLDEQISPALRITPNQAVDQAVKVAMSNTFGFGGHIAVGIFKKYEG
jgi:3-oxoacyl-[acyl-carrier-protein] synthase II